MVNHFMNQIIGSRTVERERIEVGLLHRRTVVSPHNNPRMQTAVKLPRHHLTVERHALLPLQREKLCKNASLHLDAVSYTHLDVYKRQEQ